MSIVIIMSKFEAKYTKTFCWELFLISVKYKVANTIHVVHNTFWEKTKWF